MTEGKVCNKCDEWKVFEEFCKDKYIKSGLCGTCKWCQKEYRRLNKERAREYEKEYQQINKEKISERKKEYYHKDSTRERRKERYLTNKDSILKKAKEYYRINKEKIDKRNREWQQKNKDKINDYQHSEKGRAMNYKKIMKRRSNKYYVRFTPHYRTQILNRDYWTCQCCGIKVHDESKGNWNTPNKAHIDHIIPISKGGDSTPKNLRILCRTCNLSKNNKVDEQLQLTL